jgi:heme-degrading monooxygenase HmoA
MVHLARYTLEPGYEEAFDQWYRQDHVPRMLSRRGWRSLYVYKCTTDPTRVSLYHLDDRARDRRDGEVGAEARLSEAPFREGPFRSRGIRDYFARTWRQVSGRGQCAEDARWLNVVMLDVLPDHAEAINRWYDEVHVPEILSCPGWLGNRRFVSVDGGPRFLALYELSSPELAFGSDEWAAAVGWDEHVAGIRGFHGFRVYELVFGSGATPPGGRPDSGDDGGEPE